MRVALCNEVVVKMPFERQCAVEPFVYAPDGPGAAARAIGYLRGLGEGAEA